MIYLIDISYRLSYILLASIFCILYLYLNLNDFIFIFTIPSMIKTNIIDSFIFTEPKEIFIFKILVSFFYFFFIILPFFFYLFIDYFKSGLYYTEWLKITKLKNLSLLFYYTYNILIFFLVLPIFLDFFVSLANKISLTNYFFELSALNYFKFLWTTHISLIIACLFINVFCYIVSNFSLNFILYLKRYIIIIFLLFSTIITPPDLEFQICLFLSLYICLECLFLFLFIRVCYLNYLIKKVAN